MKALLRASLAVGVALLAARPLDATPSARAPIQELIVAGRVVDAGAQEHAESRPAAGLEVELRLEHAAGESNARSRTDRQGRFRFELEDPAERPLRVHLAVPADAGQRASSRSVVLVAGDEPALEVELRRAPHGALEGRVVDETGRPLPGARVLHGSADGEGAAAWVETDSAGGFRVASYRGGAKLRAERTGHALVASVAPVSRSAGGWEPCELTMHRVGALVVRLAASAEVDLANIEIEVTPVVEGTPELQRWDGPSAWGWTDAAGRASVADVWAGVPLRVTVWGHDAEEWPRTRTKDGRLVPRDAEGAEPIVLAPSGALELVLSLGRELVVRGRGLLVGGQPPPWSSYVHVVEIDPPGERLQPGSQLSARLDDEGRFALRLFTAPDPRRLALVFGPGRNSLRNTNGIVLIDPADASGGELSVEVELGDELTLSGRVEGFAGPAEDYALRALPAGLSRLQAAAVLSRERRAALFPDGAFYLDELPAGDYDLVLEERTGALGSLVQRFPGLRAGRRELTLTAESHLGVRVELRALPPEGQPAHMTVLAGRVFPAAYAPVSGGPPSATWHFRALRPWPPEVRPMAGELVTVETGEAIVAYRTFAAEGGRFTLPATGAGWYVFGAYARGEEGQTYAPVATQPLALSPGFHEVLLDLRPTAQLRVRVLGRHDPELHVALVDEWGQPVTMRRSIRRFVSSVRIGRDGIFHLREAPVGFHRVRVGTEAELASGRFQAEQPVEVRADEETEVELEVELEDRDP